MVIIEYFIEITPPNKGATANPALPTVPWIPNNKPLLSTGVSSVVIL